MKRVSILVSFAVVLVMIYTTSLTFIGLALLDPKHSGYLYDPGLGVAGVALASSAFFLWITRAR